MGATNTNFQFNTPTHSAQTLRRALRRAIPASGERRRCVPRAYAAACFVFGLILGLYR